MRRQLADNQASLHAARPPATGHSGSSTTYSMSRSHRCLNVLTSLRDRSIYLKDCCILSQSFDVPYSAHVTHQERIRLYAILVSYMLYTVKESKSTPLPQTVTSVEYVSPFFMASAYQTAWKLWINLRSLYCFPTAFVQPPMKVVTLETPGLWSSWTAHKGKSDPISDDIDGNIAVHWLLLACQSQFWPAQPWVTYPLPYIPHFKLLFRSKAVHCFANAKLSALARFQPLHVPDVGSTSNHT